MEPFNIFIVFTLLVAIALIAQMMTMRNLKLRKILTIVISVLFVGEAILLSISSIPLGQKAFITVISLIAWTIITVTQIMGIKYANRKIGEKK